MTKRIVDLNGDIICEPEHYHETLRSARLMIDKMEEDKVDRSDMLVILGRLSEEIRFTMVMMKDRCPICLGIGEVVPERISGSKTGEYLPATSENIAKYCIGGGDLGLCDCQIEDDKI